MLAETQLETLTRKSSVFRQPRLKAETFLQGGTQLRPEVAEKWREQFQLPSTSVSHSGAWSLVSPSSKHAPSMKFTKLWLLPCRCA
jgi:hypothetical protein